MQVAVHLVHFVCSDSCSLMQAVDILRHDGAQLPALV